MITIAAKLASLVQARHNCEVNKNTEWFKKHSDKIEEIIRETAPSGSGINSGTKFNIAFSSGHSLIFQCGFHHMDEHGSYDGWTQHVIRAYPAFDGVRLTISGRDRNEIKEYLYQAYQAWLTSEYKE